MLSRSDFCTVLEGQYKNETVVVDSVGGGIAIVELSGGRGLIKQEVSNLRPWVQVKMVRIIGDGVTEVELLNGIKEVWGRLDFQI